MNGLTLCVNVCVWEEKEGPWRFTAQFESASLSYKWSSLLALIRLFTGQAEHDKREKMSRLRTSSKLIYWTEE